MRERQPLVKSQGWVTVSEEEANVACSYYDINEIEYERKKAAKLESDAGGQRLLATNTEVLDTLRHKRDVLRGG